MVKYLVIYFIALYIAVLIIAPPDPFTQFLGLSFNVVSTLVLWLFLRSKRVVNKKRVACICYVSTVLFYSVMTDFLWVYILIRLLSDRL